MLFSQISVYLSVVDFPMRHENNGRYLNNSLNAREVSASDATKHNKKLEQQIPLLDKQNREFAVSERVSCGLFIVRHISLLSIFNVQIR
jgi:hypothetical protein